MMTDPTTEHAMELFICARVKAPGPPTIAMYRDLRGRQNTLSSDQVYLKPWHANQGGERNQTIRDPTFFVSIHTW